jgi:hypothetical protein
MKRASDLGGSLTKFLHLLTNEAKAYEPARSNCAFIHPEFTDQPIAQRFSCGAAEQSPIFGFPHKLRFH